MKKSWNKLKFLLKIWLLFLLIFPFLMLGVSYGIDDLVRQLFDPAINSATIINAWESPSTAWQNFFRWSVEIDIEVTNINDFGILSVPGTHAPLCGKFVKWHYISGDLLTWTNGIFINWNWLIEGQITSGTWLIWNFKSWGVVWSLITWWIIIGKTCPIECMVINSWSLSTCIDEWLSYLPKVNVDANRKPSIIVKATRLLLTLVITLSVTMILYNWMMYIIQTGQWKEWKNLVKNIVYIVVWILISLFSVVIITIIQSVPTTLDDSTDGLLMDIDNSIDEAVLQGQASW